MNAAPGSTDRTRPGGCERPPGGGGETRLLPRRQSPHGARPGTEGPRHTPFVAVTENVFISSRLQDIFKKFFNLAMSIIIEGILEIIISLSGLLHRTSGAFAPKQPSLREECLLAEINKQHRRREYLFAT